MPNVLELPEGLLRSNEPLLLYELPDGHEVKTRLLPSNRAEKWAAKARELDRLDVQMSYTAERTRKTINALNIASMDSEEWDRLEKEADGWTKKTREIQASHFKRLKSALTSYDKDAFAQEVLDKSTTAQIVGAFERLKLYNDPFVVSEALQAERLKATMKELRSPITVETNSPQ